MLYLDFETRSEVDLTEVGTWRYATHPSTEVLMLGYSFGKQRCLWEPHLGPMPKELYEAITNPLTILVAWHSQFERLILWKVLSIKTEIDQWIDPMIRARYCSLPGALEKAAKSVESRLDRALELLKAADYDTIKKEFEHPLEVASSALRPILRAKPGCTFAIADLNAIESRGAAWVSGCSSLMQVFENKRDPYCYFASLIDPSKSYEEFYHEWKVLEKKTNRNNAKPGFLGCGYGLSGGEISIDEEGNEVKSGLLGYADSMGIELEPQFAQKCVDIFRNSYPEIPQCWYALQDAFARTVENGTIEEVGPVSFEMKGKILCINLPSGRALHYVNPMVEYVNAISKKGNPYKQTKISCEGIDQVTRQWTRIDTWGGKIFENIVQAICRDVLGYGMMLADQKGFEIVLHVHDEIVCEVPETGDLNVEGLVECMCVTPSWAPGFLVGAEGFASEYYKKE